MCPSEQVPSLQQTKRAVSTWKILGLAEICVHTSAAQLSALGMGWQKTSNTDLEVGRELAFCTSASKQAPIQPEHSPSP